MADREYLKTLTRKALIRDPSISVRRLAKVLSVNKDTALSIRNEVVEDRKKEMEKEIAELRERSVEEALVETQEEFNEIIRELWKIITDSSTTKGDKIRALKELRSTKKDIFDMMFDAGLFQRHGEKEMIDLVELFQQGLAEEEEDDYDSMSWADLRKEASKEGLYKVGMTKREVKKALRDA